MKKHLIAAAVAGALAVPAMAQVTVYGLIDQGYSSLDTKTTVAAGTTTSVKVKDVGNGGNYSSQRLGFKGEEDLGGGLKAFFTYEFGVNDNNGGSANVDGGTDRVDPLTQRSAFVGLKGGFGSVTIGRQNTAAEAGWAAGDVGGSNNFKGRAYSSSDKKNNSRSDGLISFDTPSMAGFSVKLQYGTRENEGAAFTASDKITENGIALSYKGGGITAVLARSTEKATLNGANIADGKQEQTVLGANMGLGPVKAFLTYAMGERKTAAGATEDDSKVTEIGVSYPMGTITINGSLYDGENKETTSVSKDISGNQLALLYGMSKRTTVYAVMGNTESKTSGSAAKVKESQFGFGVRHSF
jgi:predicted porin